MSLITIITISFLDAFFFWLSITAAVPKVSMIDTVVAMSDKKNCLAYDMPLPLFNVLGVCSLTFIMIEEFVIRCKDNDYFSINTPILHKILKNRVPLPHRAATEKGSTSSTLS